MLKQRVLHFHRGDVLAAAADDVLAPVNKVKRAVRADAHDIAGVKIPPFPGPLCRLPILVVTGEETSARVVALRAHQQFAGLPRRNILSLLIHQAPLRALRGPPYATGADMPRFLVGGDAHINAGLRHGPALHQRETEALLETLQVLGIHPRAETELDLPPQVILRGLRQVQQYGGDHPQIMQTGGSRGAHRLPPGGGVETIQLDDATAAHDHGHHGAQGVHVRQRQGCQHPFRAVAQGAIAVYLGVPLAHAGEILVAEHAALGRACGAGGVQHGGLPLLARLGG